VKGKLPALEAAVADGRMPVLAAALELLAGERRGGFVT
jgi:hypothetical protein